MPRTPTTPAQISGHRFLYRRIEHALIRADSKMLHDPIQSRNRAMAVSVVLMVLLLAGSAIFALIRPRGADTLDSDLVVVAETQALHIRINGRLHPIANLASARLILGRTEQPQKVTAAAVHQWPQGYPIGIAHAPSIPLQPSQQPKFALGVCEEVTTAHDGTTEIAQTVTRILPSSEEASEHSAAQTSPQDAKSPAFLAVHEGATWFIADGVRHRLDMADSVMVRALHTETARIRPVGPAFLRAIPEGRPIAAPTIDAVGNPAPFPAPFDKIGNIVSVGNRAVLVRADGAANISPVLAEVLAAHLPRLSTNEAQLADIPVAAGVDSTVPDSVPQWLNDDGWICADTTRANPTAALLSVTAPGKADGSDIIAYPQADQGGPAVDGFVQDLSLQTSRGAGKGVFGNSFNGVVASAVSVDGAPQIISGQGTRYVVENLGSLNALGFDEPVEVHWPTLAAFHEGPALTKESALAAQTEQKR